MSTTEQNNYSFSEQMNLENNKVLYNVKGELYFICKDSEIKALAENIPVPDPTSMQWDTSMTDIKTAIDGNENIIIDTVSILPNNIVPPPPSPPVTSNNITIKFYNGIILLETIIIPEGTTIPEDEVPPLPIVPDGYYAYWGYEGEGRIYFEHKIFTEDCDIHTYIGKSTGIILPPVTDDMED